MPNKQIGGRKEPRRLIGCAATLFLIAHLGLAPAVAWGEGLRRPRKRLGALPLPGPRTLFSLPDPRDLGTSHYSRSLLGLDSEVSRGILYTKKAGFLDLAHVREAADWTRYLAVKVGEALSLNQRRIDLPHRDGCNFHVILTYPAWWSSVPPDQRGHLITEASVRVAQRLTLSIYAWHEIVTWFGFKSTLIWSEIGSAFTYEDIMSHLVGVRVGGAAFRKGFETWDFEVSRTLDSHLRLLDVVSPDEARLAVQLVKGHWWADGVAIRRMINIGETEESIRPWLVRGMSDGEDAPASFPLPDLRSVLGLDLSEIHELRIRPGWRVSKRLRSLVSGDPRFLSPKSHFAQLLERIRFEVRFRFGPNADRPYDDTTSREVGAKPVQPPAQF